MKNLSGLFVLFLLLSSKTQGIQVDFTPSRNIVSCGPTTVYFVFMDTINADLISWDFGDGTGANVNNPAHEYKQTGTYTVKLIVVKNGETDSIIKENFVTVKPMPLAQMKVELIPEQMNNQYRFTSQSVHNADSFTSVTWHIDSVVLSGLSVQYTFKREGEYDIVLQATNNKGCMHESTTRIKVKPIDLEPVGISENKLAQVSIYPNPVKERMIIGLASGDEVPAVTLTDILGKTHAIKVMPDNQNLVVDTQHAVAGVYFLTLTTKQASVSKRIVIE